jgi:threonine dehydrogenase-like Zn-dependent dehydrogenase
MLMGVVERPTEIMPVLWVLKEVRVRGVLAYGDCFTDAVTALGDGRVDVDRLGGHRVALDDTEAAFDWLATAAAPPKILILPELGK